MDPWLAGRCVVVQVITTTVHHRLLTPHLSPLPSGLRLQVPRSCEGRAAGLSSCTTIFPTIPSPLRRGEETGHRVAPLRLLLPSSTVPGLGSPDLIDDAAGFAPCYGLVGCHDPACQPGVGHPQSPSRGLSPPVSWWSCQLASLLAVRVLAEPPSRSDRVVADLRRGGDYAASTLPRPDSHRLDRRTLPGRTYCNQGYPCVAVQQRRTKAGRRKAIPLRVRASCTVMAHHAIKRRRTS